VQYILLRTAWGAIAGARLLGAGGSTGRNLGHADGHPASRPKTRRHLKASRSSALGHVRQSALPAVYLLLSLVHTCCRKCSWASLERRISGRQLLTIPPLHSLAQHGRVAQGLGPQPLPGPEDFSSFVFRGVPIELGHGPGPGVPPRHSRSRFGRSRGTGMVSRPAPGIGRNAVTLRSSTTCKTPLGAVTWFSTSP